MRIILLATLILIAFAPSTVAQTWNVEATLLSDRWQYPFNFTPGSRQSGPLFILNATDAENFNRRDGLAIVQWELKLPPDAPADYEITEATLTFWDRRQAQYMIGTFTDEGIEQRLEVFPARFSHPYSEETWEGTEPYVGSDGNGPNPRNPYPIDLVTSASVENNVETSTPWAIGEPEGYTPGAMTDAFPIHFRFDMTNPTIQQEFRLDLQSGLSTWFVSATFSIDVIDTAEIPQILFAEAVSNTGFGTSQQPPSLELTLSQVDVPLSNEHWDLYE
ncbi:MAG: hypothetical protein H6752_18105 [Candidatus Omnitrophica bacterium]|nr:hypothetical protein [Candidatus Omnitrophota bacterium]